MNNGIPSRQSTMTWKKGHTYKGTKKLRPLKSIFISIKLKNVIFRSGQVRLGQVRSGQVRLGQVRSGQVRLGQVRSGQVRLGQVRSDIFTNSKILENYSFSDSRSSLHCEPKYFFYIFLFSVGILFLSNIFGQNLPNSNGGNLLVTVKAA